ncbi:MAG: short chain dehydrogenase [Hyphomonas sp.]|uniref:glucose 1-dehydrogenase n=1 Tax=Hyphomonas sp. TaxID=87 RepID=UPI001D7A9C17|nr:glucose 1-dehydrogenase [Hyphomonas sp.]MBA4228534.1 short chain dehydrogenase [Hyphomonas sp.]
MTEQTFADQVVMVTGGASGIGAATVRAFCAAGAAVVIADILDEEGEALASEMSASGHQALFVHCDVSLEPDIMAAVAAARDHFGGLHHAFNNAGIEGEALPVDQATNENWARVIEVNLRGVWWCMKHQIPVMRATGGACSIVNCASIAGLTGFAGIAAYAASKHGVVGLTRSAALDLAEQSIRVNAISPGVIQTPMIDRFAGTDASARAGLVTRVPMARIGRPEEIASAVLWLCSHGASYMTGQAIAVDGGWTAW